MAWLRDEWVQAFEGKGTGRACGMARSTAEMTGERDETELPRQ